VWPSAIDPTAGCCRGSSTGAARTAKAAMASKAALAQTTTVIPNRAITSPERIDPTMKAAEPVPRTQPYENPGESGSFVRLGAALPRASVSQSGAKKRGRLKHADEE
jgi:hypothetical protein